MKALEELEYLVNSNAEILYHLDFLKECEELYADKNLEVNDEKKYINYIEGEMTYTLTFDSWYLLRSIKKLAEVITSVEVELFELSKNNKNPNGFLKLLSKKFEIFTYKANLESGIKLNIIPFLEETKSKFDKVKNFKDFGNLKLSLKINSFSWFGKNKDENIIQIKKLYELLTENPALIECSEEEFLNAFSNKEVKVGIRWLVKGKNGKFSKSSLFYLLDKLFELELLEDFPQYDLNSKISYIFRDNNGEHIQNIRQSKLARSSNPAMSERIDKIFEDLVDNF
ncbi:hypothetical protein SDC9_02311 [bioreactor metagenome]|uniref:Uncharacterized protein n=1 Tax=bioreactor metagenome TaxID=1076179 RepID=A0A644ST28_9ZZZZ